MGNAFAAVLGTLAEIYYKLLEKASRLKSGRPRYYNAEILLRDEENQAGNLKESSRFGSNRRKQNDSEKIE
jgi:hypothetical protein